MAYQRSKDDLSGFSGARCVLNKHLAGHHMLLTLVLQVGGQLENIWDSYFCLGTSIGHNLDSRAAC